jgi:hypothetical protein
MNSPYAALLIGALFGVIVGFSFWECRAAALKIFG